MQKTVFDVEKNDNELIIRVPLDEDGTPQLGEDPDKKYSALQREMEAQTMVLMKTLCSKVGEKIYWAHEQWGKIEEHTVSRIDRGVVDSDFFGVRHMGKTRVKIIIDDDTGYYLANDIGDTLFWDKNEALAHTRQE